MFRPARWLAWGLTVSLPPLFATDIAHPVAEWTGRADDANTWDVAANWLDGVVPTADGTTVVTFGNPELPDPDHHDIALNVPIDVSSLTFLGQQSFHFRPDFVDQTRASITLRDGLAVLASYAPTALSTESNFFRDVIFHNAVDFILPQDTSWSIAYSNLVEIAGTISGAHTLTVEGGGDLLLSGDNNGFTGIVSVVHGTLGLGSDLALGSGTLVLESIDWNNYEFPAIAVADDDRTLANTVVVNDELSIGHNYGDYDLTLTGTVVLNGDTTIDNDGGLLNFTGTITETTPGTKVTIDTEDTVLFSGTTGFTGGLHVDYGRAVFLDDDALPAAGAFSTSAWGYLGLAEADVAEVAAAMAAFLARFAPEETLGTIGFDTAPNPGGAVTPNTYPGNIDLTGFDPTVALGSSTIAELTGLITPADKPDANDAYRFGGGGGTLLVTTPLTDGAQGAVRDVEAVSNWQEPLTVYLNSSGNSFTGTVTAEYSAVIFGHAPGTLPAGATLLPAAGGYIGLQDTTISVAHYLGQFDHSDSNGVIGFDSSDRQTQRVISDPIDLSAFSDNGIYLGTSTNVKLSGTITPPSGADTLRFTGFKGGQLEIAGTLADLPGDNESTPLAIVIGRYGFPAYGYYESADFEGRSSVTLSGANTYTGGTTLESGRLVVDRDPNDLQNPTPVSLSLGLGALTVYSSGSYSLADSLAYGYFDYDLDTTPLLTARTANLSLPNDIVLNGLLNIEVPSNLNDFILSGSIAGTGTLIKTDLGTLVLSNDNGDWTGGLYIQNGAVKLAHDRAAGTGPIAFGNGANQALSFGSSTPVIAGLADLNYGSNQTSTAVVSLADGTFLTLRPNGYDYTFSGSITGDGGLTLSGDGSQTLSGNNSYTGGTTLNDGATVNAASDHAFGATTGGSPAVTLDDARLNIVDANLRANLTFGTLGGVLAGNGGLVFDNTLALGENVTLSPGFSVGQLNLQGDVAFAAGGTFVVELGNGSSGTLIADVIKAETLAFTATAIDPFTIRLTGEDGAVPVNFNNQVAQSWIVAGALAPITGFDLNLITFEIDSALLAAAPDGLFTLLLGSDDGSFTGSALTDNLLVVNFSPVPEPSTWALLGTGLAFVAWQLRRRQQNRRGR